MSKKPSKRPGRDVGKMGEGTFHAWCGEADLIENRAGDDKGGWDYLVQFKPGSTLGPEVQSLDRLPTSPVCLIQVKATDVNVNPPIKLSNWKRLIDAPMPAFILWLNFAEKGAPQSGWLMHVDEEIVSLVLRRLRERDVTETQRLHKTKMALSPRAKDHLNELSGIEIRKLIEAALAGNPDGYHLRKQSWREKAGDSLFRIQVSFSPESGSAETLEDRLVDFALGLTDEMPSTLLSVEDVRFGVPVQVGPANLPQKVTLRVSERPHVVGTLEFVAARGLERACLPCRVYHPWNLFPFLPKERLRYRIATKDFTLIFKHSGGADISGLPDLSATRAIADWASSMHSLRLLQGPESLTWKLRLGPHSPGGTIGVEGKSVSMSPETRALMDAAIDAETVLARIGLDAASHHSSGEQLVLSARYLREAARVLTTDRADVFVSGDVVEQAQAGTVAGLPFVVATPIGLELVVVGVALYGPIVFEQHPGLSLEPGAGKKRFLLRSPKMERLFIEKMPIAEGDNISLLPFFDRVAAWIVEKGMDVIPSIEGMAPPPPPPISACSNEQAL